jgi:polysaccharide pyruvyl transferase WcaK-like protein
MYDEIFELIQNGELNKAQEQLENTPENDPKRYNISGLIYYQKKEFDKAKEEFEKGLKINPVDSDLLFNYGYLLKNINQEKEAWRYLMRIHNKDWATYDLLGDIEYKNRSKLASLRFYKKAAELPNSPNEMKKKFIDMRNIVKQDTKIAFLCLPGLDNFLKDIVETFSLGYDVKLVVTTDGNQISEAIKWADIVWLEWANDLAIFATNQIPEIQNKKVVCRLHRYEAFTQFPEKINWKNVDFLIFVAESMKKTFHELHPNINLNGCKEEIVYNGVDLDKFKFLIHKPGYNLSVLAHINYRKNPETWVQIIGKLKEIDNRYKLHVGGDFQDPLYKIYFDYIKKEMKLENNFILHGWINEVDKFLEDKDYTLSTSIHESFGYNIAEAMARGIKPIIHNFDGAKSLWPNELIYNTIDEAVEKITEEFYDSESYRRFIEDNYSLEKQICKIEKIMTQQKLKSKANYYTIIGSYGSGNLGDEMIGYSILKESFLGKNIKYVGTFNPKISTQLYGNYSFFDYLNPNEVFEAINNSEGLIFGGGGIFYDYGDSKQPQLLYRVFLSAITMLYFRKPVFFLNIGCNGVHNENNRQLLREIFEFADFISVRDKESFAFIKNLGVKNEIFLGADNVFLLHGKLKFPDTKKQNTFGIELRPIQEIIFNNPSKDQEIAQKIAFVVDELYKTRGLQGIFYSTYLGYDDKMFKLINSYVQNKNSIYRFENNCNIIELLKSIKQNQFFVGMSLHSLIFSSLVGTKFLGISYNSKVKTFCEMMNEGDYYIDYPDFSTNKLLSKCLSLIENENLEYKLKLEELNLKALNSHQKLNEKLKSPSRYKNFKIESNEMKALLKSYINI